MILRSLFFLLVFANLVFFAWMQGYFGGSDPNFEPDRVNQQLQPEKLRIIAAQSGRETPTPAPVAEGRFCRVVSGLSMVEAEALKAAASGAGAEALLQPLVDPAQYLVLIGDLPNAAAVEKKTAELRRLNITEIETVATTNGRQEIVLGRLPGEAAAREFLSGLNKKGIKTARVEARDQPPTKARVELRGSEASLPQQLPKLIAPYASATVGDCGK